MKKLIEKIKNWAVNTAWPWIKKSWIQIVNVFMVLFAYGSMDNYNVPGTWLVGLWAFVLLAYWIFWKFFKMEDIFKKKQI